MLDPDRPMRSAISRRIAALLTILSCGAVVCFGIFWHYHASTDEAPLNIAGRQRMYAVELGAWAQMVASGQDENRAGLKRRVATFERTLTALEQGGEVDGRILPRAPDCTAEAFAEVRTVWRDLRPRLLAIANLPVRSRAFLVAYRDNAAAIYALRTKSDALASSLEDHSRRIRVRILYALAAAAVVNLVILLAGWSYARHSIIRPIARLGDTVRRIREGDLSARVETTAAAADELSRLARGFNEMTSRVQDLLGRHAVLLGAVEQSAHVVVITDTQGRIEYVNPQFTRSTGYEAEEVIGENPRIWKSGETPPEPYAVLWKTIRSGNDWHGVFHNKKKDGELFWASSTISPVRDPGGVITHFVAVQEDITERNRAAQTLEHERARLDAILRHLPVGVVFADAPSGKLVFANKAAERMWGRPLHAAAELVGPDGGVAFHPDGRRIAPEDWPLARSIRDGEIVVGEEIDYRRADGTVIRQRCNSTPVYDDRGNLICGVVMFQDVTEEKEVRDQLFQAQKMESIGRLAGAVAHDFNNILSVIIGVAELAMGQAGLGDRLQRDLAEIHKAGVRAGTLTRQLLAFGRKQILQPRMLDLNSAVGELTKMLARVVEESIEVKTILDPQLGSAMLDPIQIDQVLLNLVINAKDAIRGSGVITIETGNVSLDTEYARTHQSVTPGEYVVLAVTDTGTGMDDERLQQIFEPFFTTKAEGQGTGLGLATVYGIVKQSRGHIWVYSELGKGTTFKVYFPRVKGDEQKREATSTVRRLSRGSETVLVVEDEDMVRRLAVRTLKSAGYSVLEAGDAEEATRICEQRAVSIHLLLTDVVMPRMNGPALAARIRELRPEIQVIFMSGYAPGGVVQNGALKAGAHFLQKPFTPDTMTRKVREVLDGQGEPPSIG